MSILTYATCRHTIWRATRQIPFDKAEYIKTHPLTSNKSQNRHNMLGIISHYRLISTSLKKPPRTGTRSRHLTVKPPWEHSESGFNRKNMFRCQDTYKVIQEQKGQRLFWYRLSWAEMYIQSSSKFNPDQWSPRLWWHEKKGLLSFQAKRMIFNSIG
jgi:hypothetical protein